jgi:F420-non-reducing hydrogenase iron-sulfur subunit
VLLRLLRQFGVEEERCRFDYVCAGEGEKFVQVVTDFVAKLKSLGPLQQPSITTVAHHLQA